jgi:hypothetical protein
MGNSNTHTHYRFTDLFFCGIFIQKMSGKANTIQTGALEFANIFGRYINTILRHPENPFFDWTTKYKIFMLFDSYLGSHGPKLLYSLCGWQSISKYTNKL